MKNRKVLFITYAFPPMGGGGVFRLVKFAKFLPQFGWSPRILTVKKAFHPLKDESLLQEIPRDIKITRVGYFEPGFLFKNRYWQSFLSYLVYPFFCIPDKRIFWFLPALISSYKIIKKEKIELILTSSASATDHLAALCLKKLTGVNWVADFRDEWSTNNYLHFYTPVHRYLANFLEKKVVINADKVIAISEPITRVLQRHSNKDKFITLTNGFDAEDFAGIINIPRRKYCQLIHLGALYGLRSANIFQEAIKELNLKDLKVEFVGGKHRVSHQEAIRAMRKADILLLVLGAADREGVFTGKIFEYLASRRPILALAPQKSSAAQLIKKLKVGQIANPQDKEEIKKTILALYRKWQNGELNIPHAKIDQFDRQNLTKELAEIFNSLQPSRKVKICLVANTRSPQNERLSNYLKEKYELHFISLDNTNVKGIKNYHLKQKKLSNLLPLYLLQAFLNKYSALRQLKKIIHQINPDLVHGHGINFSGILASYSGFHPVLLTTRGSDVMKISEQIKPEQYLIKSSLKKANLVTGSSLALKNKSIELGLDEDKFRLVFFGVDKEVFRPKNVNALRRKLKFDGKKVIFCPRALKPVYNIDVLVKSVANLKDKNCQLLLLGYNADTAYVEKIKKLIRELKLENQITWLPATKDEEMANYYNIADVVVSIAQSDGLAVSFLEAMACEKKIVLSQVGFAKEWFKDNNFWIVPIGKVKETAGAIREALDYPENKFKKIGQANRKLVLDRAEINRGFKEMENIYQELLA